MHPVTDPSMQGMGTTPSFLVEGTWVVGFFRDAKEKQQPIIMGTLPGYPQTVSNTRIGFNDPNGTYPKNPANYKKTESPNNTWTNLSGHDLEESDINRLARNDTDQAHAIVKSKDDARSTGVPIANTTDDNTDSTQEEWTEQASTYAAVYPKNHVYETESGHIKEFDDTEGAERIHEYHKSGTFYEVDASGNKHTRIVGTNYEVIAGSDFVNVKGTANLTIDSNCNTYIKGNWNIQVDGTKTEVVTGAVTQTYKDKKTETVTGDVKETYSATFDQDVTGNITIDVTGTDSTINLQTGTKGAARLDDTAIGTDPSHINHGDQITSTINSSSSTVIIGD